MWSTAAAESLEWRLSGLCYCLLGAHGVQWVHPVSWAMLMQTLLYQKTMDAKTTPSGSVSTHRTTAALSASVTCRRHHETSEQRRSCGWFMSWNDNLTKVKWMCLLKCCWVILTFPKCLILFLLGERKAATNESSWWTPLQIPAQSGCSVLCDSVFWQSRLWLAARPSLGFPSAGGVCRQE